MIVSREVELELQLDMANIDLLVAAPFLANVKMQEQLQTSFYTKLSGGAITELGRFQRRRVLAARRLIPCRS